MRPFPLKFLYLVALSRGRGQYIGCKNSMLFAHHTVCFYPVIALLAGAGYRSPIVLLFKSWSKKSLLAKIKQRGSGELLAPAPPLPLLGGFILFFLRACPLLFIGSGFRFLCSGFKSGGLVWCSQNIKLYKELFKSAVVRSL